jgi:hypothetical protein
MGYLLAIAAYTKARNAGYQKNIDNFLDDLRTIRLASYLEKKQEGKRGKLKANYLLEKIEEPLIHIAEKLGISNQNIRLNLNLSVYN